MVYESRPGETFLLGASTWRIEDITHERVVVTPAPGQPGKMPFWHGDGPGRPLELGRALGAFVRDDPRRAAARRRSPRLQRPPRARPAAPPTTCSRYLDEQAEATGVVPDDRTIVVERFRDEIGDWRVCVLSPFGAQVHAPWAHGPPGPAGRALGRRRRADLERRRHRHAPARGGRRASRSTSCSIDPDEIDELVIAQLPDTRHVRRPVPRVRGPGPAAAPPPPRPAHPAVAAAPAGRRPAAGGGPLPRLPDPAGDHPRVPQRRVRPAGPARGAHRPAGPPGPDGRGRHAAGLAVRPVAAVRLDRRLHVRGRRPAGRAPGRGAGPRPRPAARAARRRGAARAPRPGRAGRPRARAPAPGRRPPGPRRRRGPRPAAPARPAQPLGGRGPHRRARADAARRSWASGSTRWCASGGPSSSASPARSASPRPRTPPACATRSVSPCPPGLPGRLHRPGRPTRSSTSSPASPAPTARSSPRQVAGRYGVGVDRVLPGARAARGRRPGRAGRVPARRHRARVVRRRRAAPAPAPLAGRAAPRGRAGRGRRPSPASCPRGRASARPAGASTPWSRRVGALQGAALPASVLESDVLAARVADYRPADLDALCTAGEVVWVGAGALGAGDGRVRLLFRDQAGLLVAPPGDDALAEVLAEPVHRRAARPPRPSGAPRSGPTSSPPPRPPGSPTTTPRCSPRCGTWCGPGWSPTTPSPRCARSSRRRAAQGRRRGRRRHRGGSRRRPPAQPRPTRAGSVAGRAAGGGRAVVAGGPAARAPAHRHRGGPRPAPCSCSSATACSPARPRWPRASRAGSPAVYPVLKALEERGQVRRGYFVAGLGRRPVRPARARSTGCGPP